MMAGFKCYFAPLQMHRAVVASLYLQLTVQRRVGIPKTLHAYTIAGKNQMNVVSKFTGTLVYNNLKA